MQENNNKCKGILGLLFGHKFKSVYETERKPEMDPEVIKSIIPSLEKCYTKLIEESYEGLSDSVFEDVLKVFQSNKSHLICNICVRCGKTVK